MKLDGDDLRFFGAFTTMFQPSAGKCTIKKSNNPTVIRIYPTDGDETKIDDDGTTSFVLPEFRMTFVSKHPEFMIKLKVAFGPKENTKFSHLKMFCSDLKKDEFA